MKIKKKYRGMSPHRYKENPLEKRFAEAWQEWNEEGRGFLTYLMDETNRGEPNPPLSDRDYLVAATVVQWFGSPVGQGCLVEVLSQPEGVIVREGLVPNEP